MSMTPELHHRHRRGIPDRSIRTRAICARTSTRRSSQKGKPLLHERVKPEMHQSVVEVGTGVCRNITGGQGRRSAASAAQMITLAEENGLRLAAGGTHPFADWREQEIYPDERYRDDRRGHADGGARQPDLRPARARRRRGPRDRDPPDEPGALLPAAHAGALGQLAVLAGHGDRAASRTAARCSTSSRAPTFRTIFTSWGEYENFVNLLIQTNCIDNAKKIWWDIRPHPFFPTLEFRICDIPMRARRDASPSRR